jgi:hypothetical protein
MNAMRPLMKHLAEVGERTGCAIVLISHLTKKSGSAQYRNIGSVDIYAAARSVLTVGVLPFDDTMRAIVHTKSNLSSLGKSQAFGFDQRDAGSNFTWLGDCTATIDDILCSKPKSESQLEKAKRIIRDATANGATSANEIFALAADEGISDKTMKRAKTLLNVHTFRKNGMWFWKIPVEVVYEEYSEQEGQTSQEGQTESLSLLPSNAAQSQ